VKIYKNSKRFVVILEGGVRKFSVELQGANALCDAQDRFVKARRDSGQMTEVSDE
jgi:hypothetical protein